MMVIVIALAGRIRVDEKGPASPADETTQRPILCEC